ncbi:aldehyde ferredoxin oxidoreductase N-terminal domain-containing protein, partial [Chloroflexota bacterium]
MTRARLGGYVGTLLQVNLSSGEITRREMAEPLLRQFIGGTGLGAKILYDEVPPGIEWNDPENRLVFATGPLNGTSVMGSGILSVVSKGPMTNGTTSTQAGGFMGAYMKFSGFDGVVIQGAAERWSYLYLHGGVVELRDASHLVGKGALETVDLIKKELGKGRRGASVLAIGPAGENLVCFAAIV